MESNLLYVMHTVLPNGQMIIHPDKKMKVPVKRWTKDAKKAYNKMIEKHL